MKAITALLFPVLLFMMSLLPRFAEAAQIYGSLKEGEKSVGRGVEIAITCPNNTPYRTRTEEDGSYRVFVQQKGKCRFTVTYRDRTAATEIYSFDDPTRYDFELVRQPDGNYILKRR